MRKEAEGGRETRKVEFRDLRHKGGVAKEGSGTGRAMRRLEPTQSHSFELETLTLESKKHQCPSTVSFL